jgi:hypothetical protein
MPMSRKWLLALALLCANPAGAQEEPDEPMPAELPPVIYVPAPIAVVPPPPPAKRNSGGFLLRFDLGAAYRYQLKESFGAGGLHLMLGGEGRRLSFAGALDVELGASRAGLFYSTLDWGFHVDGRLSRRVRLGVSPHFGMMIISRSTNNSPAEDLVGFLIGLCGDVGIDLWHGDSGTVLAFGRLGYDFVDTGRLYSYANGVDLQIGIGFRL